MGFAHSLRHKGSYVGATRSLPERYKTHEKRQDTLMCGQIEDREGLLEYSGKHVFCLLRQGLV